MPSLNSLWKPLVVGFVVSSAAVFQPGNAAHAQKSPVVAETSLIPALPTVPASVAFSDEVAGRRTLIAARNAFRNGAASGYTAQITVSSGTGPGKATRTTPFTETLKSQLGKGLFAVTAEAAVGKTKSIRRAVVAEGNLVVTRFEDRGNPKNPPIREYTRATVDETTPLYRLLPLTGFDASSIASQWLLSETLPALRFGTLWRGGSVTENRTQYTTLYEWVRTAEDRNRRSVIQARRYLLEPKTNRLVRFEEWEQTATRGNRGNENRLIYRRESYSRWESGDQSFPLGAFSQDMPASYVEKPMTRTLPPLAVLPSETDPKALPVLERWRAAQERWVTLDLQAEQTMRQIPHSPASQAQVAPESVGRYGVQLRRHGKTRVTQEWTRGNMGRFLRNALFVSDGEQLRATNRDTMQGRSVRLDSPDELSRQLTRNGLADWGEGLGWIFTSPPTRAQLGYYTRIAYEGSATTDTGEPVEVVFLERQDSDDRRGQVREVRIALRIAVGADGMPRWIESRNETKIPGVLERDIPPIVSVFTRYRNIRTDQEPARSAFTLSARN